MSQELSYSWGESSYTSIALETQNTDFYDLSCSLSALTSDKIHLVQSSSYLE